MSIPGYGSKEWKRQLLKALEHPNFKLTVYKKACAQKKCLKEGKDLNCLRDYKALNKAKDFLLDIDWHKNGKHKRNL